jgi:hypothetical protein
LVVVVAVERGQLVEQLPDVVRRIALIATGEPALEGDPEDGHAGLRGQRSGRFGDVARAQRICQRGGQQRQFCRFAIL